MIDQVALTVTAHGAIRCVGLAYNAESDREAIRKVADVCLDLLAMGDDELGEYLAAFGTWAGDARA